MAARSDRTQESASPDVDRELAELCADHDVSPELIEGSHDLDELLDRVLEEYESRGAEDPDLRGLIRFAAQATALKEKARAATELRRTLEAQSQARRRLDEILAVLDAAILVVGEDGRIRHANRAAGEITGHGADGLVGRPVAAYVGRVEPGADGEVALDDPGEASRTLRVSRRSFSHEPGGEVVLLDDASGQDRQLDERHREDKDAALFRTLAVLSHKINNPLTSLMGRAQILQMRKEQDPHVHKAAEVIESCSRRIAGHIKELAWVIQEGRHGDLEPLMQFHESDDDAAGPQESQESQEPERP